MTEKKQTDEGGSNALTALAGDKHLPMWAKTAMAILLMPIVTVALLFFMYAKFAGLEDEFAMIAEGYAYTLTGGPVNKESSEMGMMIEIMRAQLDAIEDMRSSSEGLKSQLLATMNRIEGRMDGLENRIQGIDVRMGAIEDWASMHSKDAKINFSR